MRETRSDSYGFGLRDQARQAAPLEDPSPLALGAAAPNAVINAIQKRVLEARGLDGAIGTNAASYVDPDTVTWEERRRGHLAAPAPLHPCSVHLTSEVVLLTHDGPQRFPLIQRKVRTLYRHRIP